MKRFFSLVFAALLPIVGIAHAQQSQWLWWGATNPIPVSAANPLPVSVNGGTPTFTAGALTGSEATVAPTANTLASYLRLTNTNVAGNYGGQIQFGKDPTNPYAIFGAYLTDGSNNGAGDLVWALRNGSAGAMGLQMRLSGSRLSLNENVVPTSGRAGIDAPGTSTFGGQLQNLSNTVQIDSPNGQTAIGSSSMSLDNNGSASAAVVREYGVVWSNHLVPGHNVWGKYNEIFAMTQGGADQTLGEEMSFVNYGAVLDLDPFTPNGGSATEILRLDGGVGNFTGTITASSVGTTLTVTAVTAGVIYKGQQIGNGGYAAGTTLFRQLTGNPQTGIGTWQTSTANTIGSQAGLTLTQPSNNISAFIGLVNNGARARSGIIFDQSSLDNTAGRIACAICMASTAAGIHSLDWYTSAGTLGYRIVSTATGAANQSMTLGSNGVTITGYLGTSGSVATPTQTAGTLFVGGNSVKPALTANGQADMFIDSTTGGLSHIGAGSVSDQQFFNASGTLVCSIPDNTTVFKCVTNRASTSSLIDTSAAFNVNIGATSSTALSADRALTLDMKNVAHTLAFNATANTITFPNTASYTLIGSGDTGTVTNTMLAGSIADSKLLTNVPVACGSTCTLGAANRNTYTRLDTAGGSVATLPGATGSGDKYYLYVSVATTSAADKVLTNPTTNTIIGMAIGENAGTAKMFPGSAITAHSIQMPFTGSQPSGGFIGDTITCTDVASTIWKCDIVYQSGTTPTTPYSTATS